MGPAPVTEPKSSPAEWMTVEEYAAVKRRSKWTVYRHLKAGLIPGAEQPVPGGSYRIPVTA